MSSTFASFHLTIAAPHGDRYPVTARTQAGHEVSEALLLPLDDPTLTVYQTALDYHTPIDESVVIAVGQLLYRTLFQGTIAEAFATARTHADQQKVALRIQLAIDTDTRLSAAAALPWELMATAAGRPLMLEHALVRSFPWNDPIPDLGIPPGERIRLAVTSALPTDLANHPIAAEAEVAFIRAAITHSSRPIDLIEVPHLTRDRLNDLLTNQRPHIVHHIGHGSIQRGMGYLDIERADQSRDRLSAREFSTMIHHSGVQLVVLNACYTSSAGENLLTSFAPIFITDRIPAVIGMQAAILNRTGHCFANAFYAALGTSGSIDTSLIAARKAILADGHEHGAWGVPTIYSRVPHGQLWGDRTPQPVDPLTQRDRERITKAAQQIESDRLLNLRLQGFVGRVAELAVIRERIATMRPTGGYVLIKAAAGEGKSSSIAKLIQEAGIAQTPHHFIALTTGREYQLGLLRAVVAQLILKHGLTVSYFPEESYPAMKAEFARILDDLSKQGIEETIYLDGLDQLQPEIDGSRDLSFLPPQPPPGIVIVLGSRPDETLKPLEILHRVDYDLPPLSEVDALALWQSVQPSVADSLLHDLYTTLKGNALFVHLAADTMQGASVVDATSLIRQIEQNPQNLFGITLDRIKRLPLSKWNAVWKPMLALLLVAQEPLRLDALGDLLKQDHDTMQDAVWVLGGLVSQGIDQRVALHHLLFRDYLAVLVFNAREVKRWHQELANWCAKNLDTIWADDGDSIEQARRVYARYHYITHLALAENWPTLWQVLDAGDYGEQKTHFDPSTRLYALDLDRGRESTITAGQSVDVHIQNLPRLWKYSLLRTSLTSRVDEWPDDLFVALAMLGRTQEVLERIELCSDPRRQLKIWTDIMPWYTLTDKMTILYRIELNIKNLTHTYHNNMYYYFIKALLECDNITRALDIFKRIDDLNIQVKAGILIFKYYMDKDQSSKAKNILNDIIYLANGITDTEKYTDSLAFIALYCTNFNKTGINFINLIKKAEESAININNKNNRINTLILIAKSYAFNKDITSTLNILMNIEYNNTYNNEYLKEIANIYIIIGDIEKANKVAEDINNVQYKLEIFIKISNLYWTKSDYINYNIFLEKSINEVNKIKDHTILLHIYTLIIILYLNTNNVKYANNIFIDLMNIRYDNIFNSKKRDKIINQIIMHHGNPLKSENLSENINNVILKSNLLLHISQKYIKLGDIDTCIKLIKKTIKLCDYYKNDYSNYIEILINISYTYIEIGFINEVNDIIDNIINDIIDNIIDNEEYIIILIKISRLYIKINENIKAKSILMKAKNKSNIFFDITTHDRNLTMVSKAFIDINDFLEANEIARNIYSSHKRYEVQSYIAQRYTLVGNFNNAEAVIAAIDDDFRTAESLIFMAQGFHNYGENSRAIECLEEAAYMASAIYNTKKRIKSFILLAYAYKNLENESDAKYSLLEAQASTLHILDVGEREESLAVIAQGFANIGLFTKIIPMIEKITTIGIRIYPLEILINHYYSESNFRKSLEIIHSEWMTSITNDNTWDHLILIRPLLQDYENLATAILEEEGWVNEQLKRLG